MLPTLFTKNRLGSFSPFSMDEVYDLVTRDWPFSAEGTAMRRLPIDVRESNNGYEVKVDLPGVKKEQVDCSLTNNILTVSVTEKEETKKNEGGYIVNERRTSSAQRSITLPQAAATDNIHAEMKEGILEIHIKKIPEKQAKRIAIQ